MLSTIAACGTIKKEIGLRRDSEAFFLIPKIDPLHKCVAHAVSTGLVSVR